MFYICRSISCMKFTKPAVLLLTLGILADPRLAADEFSAVVAGVHDGDTLTVRNGEQSIRIRLSGIDSPEMNQPFGDDAQNFTAELALAIARRDLSEQQQPKRLRRVNLDTAQAEAAAQATASRQV
jgi:endonuclease YncB( thermonuclease family)